MTVPPWIEQPIAKYHALKDFHCREAALNEFFQRYALKNHINGSSKTFVAEDESDRSHVLGFYTLSPATIAYAKTPAIISRGLARYDIGVFRLARLAVDSSLEGEGLGTELIVAAGRRCQRVAQDVGGVALLIDAKDRDKADWYKSRGAIEVNDNPLQLLIPLASIPPAPALNKR
jgi:GNAT superfamily N-acetyltransferase